MNILERALRTKTANVIAGVLLVGCMLIAAFTIAYSMAVIGSAAGGREPPPLPEILRFLE